MGIRHGDISVANMMWDKSEKKGVLNDFDLAKLVSHIKPTGQNEVTGTLPFMALELLTAEGMAGEIAPLYRHELESFTWVFIYLCYAVTKTGDHFGLNVNKFIKKWFSTSPDLIRAAKLDLDISSDMPTLENNLHAKFAPLAHDLHEFWTGLYHKKQSAVKNYNRAKAAINRNREMTQLAAKSNMSSAMVEALVVPAELPPPYEETGEEVLWIELLSMHTNPLDAEIFETVMAMCIPFQNMCWPQAIDTLDDDTDDSSSTSGDSD